MDENKKRTKRNKNPNLRLIKNDSAAGKGQDAAVKSTKEKPAAVPKEKPAAVPKEKPAAVPKEKPTAVPKEKPTAVPKEKPAQTDKKAEAKKASGTKEDNKSAKNKKTGKPTVKKKKPAEKKAAKKTAAKKTGDTKTTAKKIADKKPAEKKTADKSVTEKKTADKKITEKKTADKRITERKTTDKKITDKKEDSKKIISKKSVEKKILYDRKDRERLEPGEWFVQHRSLVLIGATILALAAVLIGVYIYIIKTYTVTTVYVDGNVHYSSEEIMDMVMTGRYGNNSLYLAMKYKEKGVEGVPFVEKMDINILAPDTIRINVYEKALAGYVEYLGRYMYFDRDGIVVESSEMKTAGIPQVTGLKFDYVVLNEPLPVENDEIFAKILSITQLLTKYELTADKIFFDSSFDLTLYFGGVKVTLGSDDEIDEKIMKLKYILPELEGKQGTLRMENYTEDTKNITFHQD